MVFKSIITAKCNSKDVPLLQIQKFGNIVKNLWREKLFWINLSEYMFENVLLLTAARDTEAMETLS